MAIYALAIKHRSKGQGSSAESHAQYIAREGKYAERAQSHVEYLTREGKHQGRARELEETWSGNMPTWAETAQDFWKAADIYERQNGRVYTEVVIALPRELSREERKEVVKEFIQREIGERFSYTVAIHNPKALDGKEQPHAHVMFSIRERDGVDRPKEFYFRRANPKNPEKGGAKKSREWSLDSRSNDRVNQIRATWEELANRALERAGFAERIDRRTLEAQGIDREPEPKMGPEVTQKLKRGERTEIGDKVLELRNYRRQQEEIRELEKELKQEKAKIYNFDEEKYKKFGIGDFLFFGEKREVPEEEKRRYKRTLDLVLTRYERENGEVEYRWKKTGNVAFVDRGDRISMISASPTAIKAALQVTKEKGWGGVHATGNEEFRREAWMIGAVMGVEVTGYKATKSDLEKLTELKKEEELKKEQYRYNERIAEREALQETAVVRRDSRTIGEPKESGRVERAIASDVVKELDGQIKQLRKDIAKTESEDSGTGKLKEKEILQRLELDSLYRDRYGLKELGDQEVMIARGKDGKLEVVDRDKLKKRVKAISKGQKKGQEREPER